ncbi:serine hydrolase domain-containing protein [Qipengyuania sphaerica]|uniref:serine hydrolase domain-containing protein n=1 Tax=Qipengyuania sphaerica TaxID=2867243 RepID=UPI001C886881|nr:serine hydrolase [Qipengyuania sphaerica]MBX7540528.1 beta-lactamase family protein [Qipengyuania sphaerica]
MKRLLVSGLALAIAGCVNLVEAPEAAVAPPAVTQSMPPQMASLDPADSVLFWSDERRSAAFRSMETMFPGLEVAPANTPRELPKGEAYGGELIQGLYGYLTQLDATGIMILEDGKVRFEAYADGFGPSQRWTSFSVAKSFTSTLLGAAIADGSIASIDTPVVAIIPELAGTAYDGVTVGQVATMTSGVRWNEDYTDPDSDVAKMLAIDPVEGESQVVTYARTLEREAPAGEKWVYKTLETNLLGLIVERATGETLANYAARKIVEPAGFEGRLFWMQDLSGGNIGGCCLSLRLADYARFGQFVLEGGEGVVPASWFTTAGAPLVAFDGDYKGFGYGYQWWTYPEGNFGAQGIFGQSITIVPEYDMVVAITGNWPTATSSERRATAQQMIKLLTTSLWRREMGAGNE